MKPFTIIRSNRRTVSITVTTAGEVIVRAPRHMEEALLCLMVESREDWIQKQLKKVRRQENVPAFSREELEALRRSAREDFSGRVAYWAPRVGVTCGSMTIRAMRSQWGSCRSSGNLTFNCLLMLAPPEVRDYVVVHELCHRKEMNHSPAYWAAVEKVMPDYRRHRQWLKDNGDALIARLANPSG